jgi:chromosome segregation ATPase
MLTSLTIINSKVYGKAEIRFNDCDSLQLVGPNNIGKSTLIYALNFLFIIDGNKMTFSGNRRGDKETIHHYFPNPNQSYIVFEVFKKAYYCILLKRDSEGNLEYYKYQSDYKESHYVDAEKRLMKFDEVQANLASEGITLEAFKDKREVFNFVYQRGRRNNGVVWLDDNVKSDGLSNNFSKIYRYLINTKLITNKNLKEALIIADNRENESLNFSQKNKKDIYDLRKINNEIRNLKSVKNEFDEFREIVSQYSAKSKIISQLYAAFTQNYEHTLPSLQAQLVDKTQTRAKINTEINEDLNPKKSDLDRKIGGKDAEIQNEAIKVNEKEIELKTINSFEPEKMLNESLANYDKKRKEIESRLTMIDIQKLNSKQIEYRVMTLKNQVTSFENQIKNYSDLLINKISGNKDNRKLLNAILSEQVKALPGEQVKKAIHKISDSLKIFDGEIDISKNIIQKDFESIEEITEKLNQAKTELKSQEQLLETVKDIEKSQSELQTILIEIDVIKVKLQKIKSKPALVKSIEKMKAVIATLNTEKEQFETDQKSISKKIAQKSNELIEINEEIKKREDRISKLQENKRELEAFGIAPDEFDSSEDLDLLYNKIKLNQNDRYTLKINKDNLFEKLREKLQSTFADEQDFISYVEEEIALIDDKERSIQSLLESISTQFANPAYTLLKRYDEFKEFVNNKFNHKLSQSRISDIESLTIELVDNKKLVEEVKKISQIQQVKGQLMFEFDHSENLKVLDAYLDSGKAIEFENLFDITLHLTRKGNTKPVDLNEQIESDGTDKMIRLMIVMNIINRLAIADDENRIVLFIDEVATIDKQNRPELVRFCREHYFIPIFAAPDAVAGFGKYYFIYPNAGKINVNEKINAMYGESNTVSIR